MKVLVTITLIGYAYFYLQFCPLIFIQFPILDFRLDHRDSGS